MSAATDLERLRDIVADRLGLHFEDGSVVFVADTLAGRARATKTEPGVYLARLCQTSSFATAELAELASQLTVPETYFFRNDEQLRAFCSVVKTGAGKSVRVLSVGCASGEEPYSIAILAREAPELAGASVSIRAIDLSPRSISRARRGHYTEWSLRETSTELRRRWFRREGREHVLDASIRSAVSFEVGNVTIDDPSLFPEGGYDVVFCRNVVMYFTPDALRRAIGQLTRALVPGGHMFLGHAENLRGVSDAFDLCHTHDTFYYRRRPSTVAAPYETRSSWVDEIARASARVRELTGANASAAPGPTATRDLSEVIRLVRAERFADAIDAFDALPGDRRREPGALLVHAVLQIQGGAIGEGERLCAELLAVDAENAGAHYVLALCRDAAGDLAAAAMHDRIASRLDPAFAMPHFHLGLLARRGADPEGTRIAMTRALELLASEDEARLDLFGGGFDRDALTAMCRAQLRGGP